MKRYANIFKIYTKHQAAGPPCLFPPLGALAGPWPPPPGRAAPPPGRRRLVVCIYLVYISYISCYIFVYNCIYLYILNTFFVYLCYVFDKAAGYGKLWSIL